MCLRLGKAPDHLAGLRIERDYVTTITCHRNHLPIDVGRRRTRRAWSEASSIETPEFRNLAEVLRCELVRRRIPRMPRIATEIRSDAVLRPRTLCKHGEWHQGQRSQRESSTTQKSPGKPAPVGHHYGSSLPGSKNVKRQAPQSASDRLRACGDGDKAMDS